MALIPAKDIGRLIFQNLVDAVNEEYPDATEEEKNEAMARILEAWGEEMFCKPRCE